MSAERSLPQPTPNNAEGGYPQPPQDRISLPEAGISEGFRNLITSLVEQQTPSYEDDFDAEQARYYSKEVQAYNLLIDLRVTAPDIWHDTVANVFTAYGSLIYDRLPETMQSLFLYDARNEQMKRGIDLVLTGEEGGILQSMANAVGVEYNPGGAENTEQKTFTLADIEAKAPDTSDLPDSYKQYFSQGQDT